MLNHVRDEPFLWITGAGVVLFALFAGLIGAMVLLRVRADRERLLALERAKSDAKLRTILEAVPQFVWGGDAHGSCNYLSPQWVAYTGRPEASQRGTGWLSAIHPADRDALVAGWRRSVETGAPFDNEARILGADGVCRWFKQRVVPLRDTEGRIESWVGIFIDITNVIDAKSALERSEERIDLALRVGGFGSWDWDLTTDEIIWSGSTCRILGCDDNGGAPMPIERWRDCVHPQDLPRVIVALRLAREEHAPYHAQYRIRRFNDGKEVWIDCNGRFFYDAGGQPVRMVGVLRDISELREQEDRLRESEARLRRFIEVAPAAIAMFDREMRYVAASRRFVTDYGLDGARIIGRSHYEVFPEIPQYWRDIHQRCLRGATERHDGEPFVRASGEVLWLRWEIQPWYDARGSLGGIAMFSEDISLRKQAEDALFREKEQAQVTLHSIGDAVITTDPLGFVEYLNPVAETLTGWTSAEAARRELTEVFRIVDEHTRLPAIDPVTTCLTGGCVVGLANHTILISRDGEERQIADTAAPIRNRDGTVLGAVLVFHDVSENRRLTRQLAHDATHDALTGLVNRGEFEQRLEHAVASARRFEHEHTLCYFDLDQFKLVNDTVGHAAGDALLKQVRGLLAGKFRERDTLARLGGDEFAVLLESCSLSEGGRIADVIVTAFREWQFTWSGRTFQIGISVGVVPVNRCSTSAQQLLAEADIACYTAKERGRNRVHVYRRDGAEPSPQHAQMLVAATLRDALAENRFCLYGQPIVALSGSTGAVHHCEVLLRMIDTDGRIVLPGAFIPAAERYGLMAAIDRWVIEHAFRAHAALNGARDRVRMAINLSGESLNTDDFAQFLLHQFVTHDVRSDRICFEITETAAIQNLEQAQEFIADVKARGSRFALDDFGSGLSSFRYLRELPADYLKIDGSFVCNMSRDAHDEAVVAAINEVSHALGIDTVGEYAHDAATVERLRHIGVDYAQGYAFGAPEPLERLLALPA